MILLVVAIIRAVAFPIVEPLDRSDPGLAFQLYSYSVLIWVPALGLIALSAILPLWLRVIRWVEGRN
ncbi:hypothetical protein BWQ93_04760 [Sphingopyxis sp. QXT-31]|uniref:hypothetical protein n=1 Tax=Sphingopyxis sp. QXT-31 TaxID=1357916 RepID=UPI0009791628|nr:hypothetical protein [Sphingopyxis sp. QXT-31]APZ97878.1 hypothetical protein BWQ93_04760 [Sphingopyxis sp. QXT-31]